MSDGISSILSDQEIVDLVRGAPDPKAGANRILAFSQELGGDDNATAIVIPLIGWGKVQGPDKTKGLRALRLERQICKCFSDYTLHVIYDGPQLGVNAKEGCSHI